MTTFDDRQFDSQSGQPAERLRARLRQLAGAFLSTMVLLMLFEQTAWAAVGLPSGWADQQTRQQGEALTASRSFVEGSVREGRQLVEAGAAADHRQIMALREAQGLRVSAVAGQRAVTREVIGGAPRPGFQRLPGHVLDLLPRAMPDVAEGIVPYSSSASAGRKDITLTVILNRGDQAGFDRYLKAVQDPHSEQYRRFLSPAQITQRFGPSRDTYGRVLGYVNSQGLELIEGSKNRMTLTVRGTRAQVERAFATDIADFRIGQTPFYANRSDPALPTELASKVQSISGLSDLGKPVHAEAIVFAFCAILVILSFLALAGAVALGPVALVGAVALLGLCAAVVNAASPNKEPLRPMNFFETNQSGTSDPNPYQRPPTLSPGGFRSNLPPRLRDDQPGPASAAADAVPLTGAGQTVGLVEFASYLRSDVADYLALIGAPAERITNIDDVPLNGGAALSAQTSEVLLDIDSVMTIAPEARVRVYHAPFDGRLTSYATVFNAMIDDQVDVISNSWASCEDQVSLADAQGLDSVLQTAAAAGISVFNATGDTGSTCLDGSENTASIPASSPNATAVGGSALRLGNGYTYGGETWWDGGIGGGQGGYGISRFFTRPAYQNGLVATAMRSIPDVVINADPSRGIPICEAAGGGCPASAIYGGTSLAAPQWAAFTALFNQVQGAAGNLGAVNPLLYSAAGTAGFHSAASMGSDFAHVGLGSPNLERLALLLSGRAAGAPDPARSRVQPLVSSVVPVNDSFGPPADGVTPGGVMVVLRDANGYSVSGQTVTLIASSPQAVITPASAITSVDNGTAIFTVTNVAAESVSFSASVAADPAAPARAARSDASGAFTLPQTATLNFGVPPATAASITALTTTAVNDGVATVPITVTLRDSLGRPTPGKQVAIAQGSGRSLIAGPASGATGADGTIVFNVSSTVAETVTYSARVVSDGNLPVPGSVAVTFGGAASTSCASGPPTPAPGYAITPYSNGYLAQTFFFGNVNFGCSGASNPTFDAAGNVYVANFRTGDLYRLPPGGGAVTLAYRLSNLGLTLGQPIFGRDGNLYATRTATTGDFRTGDLIQIDPASGALLRVVAANLTCPGGLVEDPLSGDLFFNGGCFGGGSDVASIFRVQNPAAVGGQPTTVSVYATLPRTPNFGMSFSPDGTLYAMTGYLDDAPPVLRISGTNRPQPASLQAVPGLTSRFFATIGEADAAGAARSLLVDPGPFDQRVLSIADITGAAPVLTPLLSPAGAGTTGPDGCQYLTTADAIYRLAPTSGPCRFAPSVALPSLSLSPASVAPNPAQGSAQTLTATLRNIATPAGLPILFSVTGANSQVKLVRAGADGLASFTYSAVNPGRDTITASVSVPSSALPTLRARRPAAAPSAAPARPAAPADGRAAGRVTISSSAGDGIAYAASTAAVARGRIPAVGVRQPEAVSRPDPVAAPRATQQSARTSANSRAASATGGTDSALVSNVAEIIWTAGPHTSFLSLNPSPISGTPGQPVMVAAALADVSASPAIPAAGQFIDFTLGTGGCRGTTDAAGLARCAITPAAIGASNLRAAFAGTSALLPSSASVGFMAVAAPPPVPTVTLTVSPGSLTLGQSAALTWSSTNATGCTASGAWTNSRATSGSETVTPTATGSAVYTLSCTGAGGTTAANTTLTVNAAPAPNPPPRRKGGALDLSTLLGLLLLASLMQRRRAAAIDLRR